MRKNKNCMCKAKNEYCDFILRKYGYCCYSIKPNEPALIFNLYIYKEFRMRGFARLLLLKCIKAIRISGYIGKIEIKAEPKENSICKSNLIAFYSGMGLKVIN